MEVDIVAECLFERDELRGGFVLGVGDDPLFRGSGDFGRRVFKWRGADGDAIAHDRGARRGRKHRNRDFLVVFDGDDVGTNLRNGVGNGLGIGRRNDVFLFEAAFEFGDLLARIGVVDVDDDGFLLIDDAHDGIVARISVDFRDIAGVAPISIAELGLRSGVDHFFLRKDDVPFVANRLADGFRHRVIRSVFFDIGNVDEPRNVFLRHDKGWHEA